MEECHRCSLGKHWFICGFYSPLKRKCDFPKRHNFDDEMKQYWKENNIEWRIT